MKPLTLYRLRRRLHLTQAAMAALVGVAPNTVARWERGELAMRPTTARLVAFVVADYRRNRTKEKR